MLGQGLAEGVLADRAMVRVPNGLAVCQQQGLRRFMAHASAGGHGLAERTRALDLDDRALDIGPAARIAGCETAEALMRAGGDRTGQAMFEQQDRMRARACEQRVELLFGVHDGYLAHQASSVIAACQAFSRRAMFDTLRPMRHCLTFLLPLLIGLLIASPHAAADDGTAIVTAAHTLSLEQIMADPDWLGNGPERAYWSDDGETVYFLKKRQGADVRDLWRIARDGGPPERVPDEQLGRLDGRGDARSRDRRQKVYTLHGDLFVKDLASGTRKQLTRTAARERAPFFLADGQRIGFRRGDQILVRDLVSGLEAEVVALKASDDPAEETPADDFLARQQRRLFEIVRKQQADEIRAREDERARSSADPTRVGAAFFLGEDIEIVEQHLSPSGTWLLVVTRKKKRDDGRHDHMASYVSADGYVDVKQVRVKVGSADPVDHRLTLVDLATHTLHDLDLSVLPGIREDPLADLRAAARARQAERAASHDGAQADGVSEPGSDDKPGESSGDGKDGGEQERDDRARPVEIEEIQFTEDGSRAVIQAHSYDNKDRWIALVEPSDEQAPTLVPIHRLSDPEGWINWSFNELGWLRDGRRLWFLSEESGWSQLYLYDLDTSIARRLSDGDYLSDDVELDPSEHWFYFTANRQSPDRYETYRVPVVGGPVEQVTDLGGITRSQLSPDGRQLLITHSGVLQPPELFVQEAEPGASPRQLTHTVSQAFTAIAWQRPRIVPVPSSHAKRPIWSRLYLPAPELAAGRDAAGKRPAVVFIHGAGYLQDAHSGWSGYFREMMFHTLLTREGYVVLDMDYRGSRGYGRDWRTAIYRQMGHPEVEDLADGVAYMVSEHGVDPARVGVYGGSYGGFLTFMAMFRRPDLFACGAALRPVTDWAHYNHPYTSNILNTPDIDPEAYRRSSPIEHAAGLEKPLLICSGMQDDNVFFQDTVRLVQHLIELGKTGFETAFFPIEHHGFTEPSSWLAEYRRIFALFERYLKP